MFFLQKHSVFGLDFTVTLNCYGLPINVADIEIYMKICLEQALSRLAKFTSIGRLSRQDIFVVANERTVNEFSMSCTLFAEAFIQTILSRANSVDVEFQEGDMGVKFIEILEGAEFLHKLESKLGKILRARHRVVGEYGVTGKVLNASAYHFVGDTATSGIRWVHQTTGVQRRFVCIFVFLCVEVCWY